MVITLGKEEREVLNAINNDNLVFFCGAGISRNYGLPSSKKLVEKVCKNLSLSIKDHPDLKKAKKLKNYDLILDIIENKIIPKEIVRKKVIEILNKFNNKPPEIHKLLLELSSCPRNDGYRLVTTNFDRLFFKAGLDERFVDVAPKLSHPRKETWKNLTFLHGRIDEENDSEGSNLILTRTDFGLAYLYDRWASRFIIQLFQDFTILFIGYSLEDTVMNYLMSAIISKNKRREGNKETSSIYALVGYKKKIKEEEKNKWEALGVTPIFYEIKKYERKHSQLYEKINRWAIQKRKGLKGRRDDLKELLRLPYRDNDLEKEEIVISILKTDKQLAKYFHQINFAIKPKKDKKVPVDISWLKPFANANLLENLYDSIHGSNWSPLSDLEKSIVQWLIQHLDKKELIHWFIKQSSHKGLIVLHPEFKDIVKIYLKSEANQLEERQDLFWRIVSTQKIYFSNLYLERSEIELNNSYSYEKSKEILSCLEPMIRFDISFYNEKLKSVIGSDKIYEANLTIKSDYSPLKQITNKQWLFVYAEDFTNLLKEIMELASFSKIIQNDQDDFSYFQRPSIASHEQNKNYDAWTYLIDLVRDSFDCAMKKDKKLAKLLIARWQCYPYSVFYRLLLYAVTKYPEFEDIVIKLFEKKTDQTLWSSSCQKEVLDLLRNGSLSEHIINKNILPLIMKGPPYSNIKDASPSYLKESKERSIYLRLHHLQFSGFQFLKDIEKFYKEIPNKYSFKPSTKEEAERESFPVYMEDAIQVDFEKRYHDKTVDEIYKEIQSNKGIKTNKKENFRSLSSNNPDKAYKVLLKFKDKGETSHPYWSVFIAEASMIKDNTNNDYFLKTLQNIEGFSDIFFKKCLWSLIHGLNQRGVALYNKDNFFFNKWWHRLWELAINNVRHPFSKPKIALNTLNSDLGKLSQVIFHVLWSYFPEGKIDQNKKLPKEITTYFEFILKEENLKNSSVLYHFGKFLWYLWLLDEEWVGANFKKLIDWKEREDLCKAFWTGWLHHPKWNPDFLLYFKKNFLEMIINRNKFYITEQDHKYTDNIAGIILISTGGKEIKNIFEEQAETQKIIQSMDIKIVEALFWEVWHLLENAGDKSQNLWSEKINPWIKQLSLFKKTLTSFAIAKNLSYVILNCGNKLPEAFDLLKSQIEGQFETNNYYISLYIKDKMDKELSYIFDYPKELLKILHWNFPEDEIHPYMGDRKIKQILDKLKEKDPNIENNFEYKKLFEKILHLYDEN